jgi:energy-coupling factor transporter ATP-binding protein EcfA2
MKTIEISKDPINILINKDIRRDLYVAIFDSKQIQPRVEIGSYWVAIDQRHERRFLMRMVEAGYNDKYDLQMILASIRENPNQPFDARSLEYYCAELGWMQLEGEFSKNCIIRVSDQPTVLQTFLKPTTDDENNLIAAPDTNRGFPIGNLRNGDKVLPQFVTLEDRFMGSRTAILGASGYGKSTLIRNVARFWLENTRYGKVIDDLKCEYVFDISDERDNTVSGLSRHPNAKKNLYLLTSRPDSFSAQADQIAGVIPLRFTLEDIPPESLKDVATHLTPPQRGFLEMFDDRTDLFRTLLKKTPDGDTDTSDWHNRFKAWIILKKEADEKAKSDANFQASVTDFQFNSYQPIHGVTRQLERLVTRPFMARGGEASCLPKIKKLLEQGATIVLDKAVLTDTDKILVSTVLAGRLYDHNMKHSSGSTQEQAKVIPFVYLVEEAHLLLSSERTQDGSVFVNFAKTGRSFQIGLIAVTQRPSSVDSNIMSQFDNFVTLRLTNEEDVKDLLKAQSMFRGYEGQIRSMGRGAAVTAFGEPTKVQAIQVFEWNEERASKLLSEEQAKFKFMINSGDISSDANR